MNLVQIGGVDWVEHVLPVGPPNKAPLSLKADCLIQIVSGQCTYRGAVLKELAATVDSKEAYFKHQTSDWTITDLLQQHGERPCHLRIRYLAAPRKYRKYFTNVFSTPASWVECAEHVRVRLQSESTRIAAVVCGPVRSGKSTFVSYLANTLICRDLLTTTSSEKSQADYQVVAVIDADLGQPLRGLPGVVSISLHDTPDLGCACANTHSFVVGDTTPDGHEVSFVRGFLHVWWIYQRYLKLLGGRSLPLIVNCCGWSMFMGAQLIDLIAGIVGATDLIHLNAHDAQVVTFGSRIGPLLGAESRIETQSPLQALIHELNVGPGPFPYLSDPESRLVTHELESVPPPSGLALAPKATKNGVDIPSGPEIALRFDHRVRSASLVPSLTGADKRHMRLAQALFAKSLIVRCDLDQLNESFISQYVSAYAITVALSAVNFVSEDNSADQVDTEFNGSVVYVTQNGWLLTVGIVTDIDWGQRKCYLYTRRDLELTLKSNGTQDSYTFIRYPEYNMETMLMCLRVWKKSLTVAHDQRVPRAG